MTIYLDLDPILSIGIGIQYWVEYFFLPHSAHLNYLGIDFASTYTRLFIQQIVIIVLDEVLYLHQRNQVTYVSTLKNNSKIHKIHIEIIYVTNLSCYSGNIYYQLVLFIGNFIGIL